MEELLEECIKVLNMAAQTINDMQKEIQRLNKENEQLVTKYSEQLKDIVDRIENADK